MDITFSTCSIMMNSRGNLEQVMRAKKDVIERREEKKGLVYEGRMGDSVGFVSLFRLVRFPVCQGPRYNVVSKSR